MHWVSWSGATLRPSVELMFCFAPASFTPMTTVAIIPARGGSVGIPGKNLKRVGGIELVARSIRAAKSASTIDRVVVTTDHDAIASVARREEAEVVDRPSHLADSISSSESALQHALNVLGLEQGIVVMLQCTSPFTTADMVDGTVQLVINGAQSALTVAPSHRFLWCETDEGGRGINHDQAFRLRRQDMSPEYVETGAVYAIDLASFLEAEHRFVGRVGLHVTDPARADEIDNPADLERAGIYVSMQRRAYSCRPHRGDCVRLRRRVHERSGHGPRGRYGVGDMFAF